MLQIVFINELNYSQTSIFIDHFWNLLLTNIKNLAQSAKLLVYISFPLINPIV